MHIAEQLITCVINAVPVMLCPVIVIGFFCAPVCISSSLVYTRVGPAGGSVGEVCRGSIIGRVMQVIGFDPIASLCFPQAIDAACCQIVGNDLAAAVFSNRSSSHIGGAEQILLVEDLS